MSERIVMHGFEYRKFRPRGWLARRLGTRGRWYAWNELHGNTRRASPFVVAKLQALIATERGKVAT